MADYLEPDWSQDIPGEAAVRRALGRVAIEPAPLTQGALAEFVDALRSSQRNGGAEFARFRVGFDPALHWYGSRNRFEDVRLVDQLVAHPVIRHAVPIEIPPRIGKPLHLAWSNGFALDGELSLCLFMGGAYNGFEGSAADAKALASAAVDDLLQQRFDEVQIYTTGDRWTPWFKGIAWDQTWFGFDKSDGTFWLLAVTDED